MEEVRESFNYLTSRAFIGSVIVLLIMFVILHVIKQYLVKKVAYAGKDSQHINTFYGVEFILRGAKKRRAMAISNAVSINSEAGIQVKLQAVK